MGKSRDVPPVHIALLCAWIALPVLGGGAIGDALARLDADASRWWSVASWVLWAAVLAALAIPKTTTLTAVRILVPAAGALAAWAALLGPAGAGDAAALTCGAVGTILVLTPAIGARFVDGSSYGDERRLPLRAPSVLLMGPIPLAAAVAVLGAAGGPALLMAGAIVPGLVATVVGVPAAAGAVRALHQLSRRWIVFVPAGVVIHDHLVLAEPVLFGRRAISSMQPAPTDSQARDLTAGAPGLALQLDLLEPITIGPAARRGEAATAEEITSMLIVPTLPGETLAEAGRRRIHVPPRPMRT